LFDYPHGFLDALKTPAILDEVQNVPASGRFASASYVTRQ
jgi:hypothetical protein